MNKYRTVTLAVVALFLSVSFLASSVVAAEMTGVMMKDGKMMMMKDGKMMGPMDHEMTMTDGTKMMMDGKMMMKDGKEMHMKEGQMMMMDGKMTECCKDMMGDKRMMGGKDMKMEGMNK